MHKWSKLYEVQKKYYPTESNYCGVIAVALALEVSFGAARSLLFKQDFRFDGEGSSLNGIRRTLERKGKTVKTIYSRGFIACEFKGARVATLEKSMSNTRGTYILLSKSHAITIIDGIVEDWTSVKYLNGRKPHTKLINTIWKIEDK